MSHERPEQPALEAWRHEQRAIFEQLIKKEGGMFVAEAPTGWKPGSREKLSFDRAEAFPLSYLAEQVQAPRGSAHFELELVDWNGEEPLDARLEAEARRQSGDLVHPVSFKTLLHPTLQASLTKGHDSRNFVMTGVVAHSGRDRWYPVIGGERQKQAVENKRTLHFYTPSEIVLLAQEQSTALFFVKPKKFPRDR